nr:translation elongation factor Ts [Myxococcota bacterium]
LVELGCETDFVARTDDFQGLASALAGVVAADASIDSPEALADAAVDGEKVSERIQAAIGKLGENMVVKRVARLAVDGAGRVGGYVHAGGKLGVLVGLATAASGDAVDAVARDLAMHVAAADPSPLAIDRDGVPADAVAAEREIFRKQALQSGKPEKIVDKIVDGRIGKYFSEVCLVEQAFVKDPDRSVGDVLKQAASELGAELDVTGFVRFKLGEASDS